LVYLLFILDRKAKLAIGKTHLEPETVAWCHLVSPGVYPGVSFELWLIKDLLVRKALE